jgi:hypothetical protein
VPHRSWLAAIGACMMLSASSTLLIGCAGRSAAPTVATGPYSGPPISAVPRRGTFVALVQAPSAGWKVRLDAVLEENQHRRAFITLQQPNPAFVYAQAVVEQQVATGVPEAQNIRIYARIIPFDAPHSNKDPYALAAKGDAAP